ncbi:WecB/TagA/CpsF family glycosyltransferase [Rheinheimera tangshanensis]|uniref:WecB/TagA/CpsF family glycosyltransferase n=1 Tax=Rheinheimera tangshanensis TaxID=400153 RepID=A0A5C8LW27_9GAMM|nr:WecB/TagA/CpsF family glycosyltransferase [Rheinheimera tangshanensis]TXK80554.1 WecB/TagA/CpsF family glycosyltransferase [Rheinheimera tangshanensis]GGM60357.1 UDP-hexose transferase [Rheinheimera tangshanensis]
MFKPVFDTVNVGGIQTACVSREELALLVGNICSASVKDEKTVPFVIFSNNGHAISIYNSDKEAREQMNQADLVHADGQSVVSFSRWFGKGKAVPERTATTDMIHDIPNYYSGKLKHFLLGGKESSVSKAGEILAHTYNNFDVVGHQHGYFTDSDEDAICNAINKAKPDVLWVGLGKPKEQIFCIRNKDRLNVPVIISCGGCYNYITGEYPRAPIWMQNAGLEWLFRMASDPRKLFIRYLLTNPHAIFCVVKNGLAKRISG